MGGVVETVSDVLFGKAPDVTVPEAKIPAISAPNRREDSGANIVVGADASKNKRVSGRGSVSSSSSGGDVLGGLGRGGLSI